MWLVDVGHRMSILNKALWSECPLNFKCNLPIKTPFCKRMQLYVQFNYMSRNWMYSCVLWMPQAEPMPSTTEADCYIQPSSHCNSRDRS